MRQMTSRSYDCALITGASSGLGEEFARQLAPRCRHIVLVARRRHRLETLALSLENYHPGLSVHIQAADLSDPRSTTHLLLFLASERLVPDLVVNNAGLGDYGDFVSSDWSRVEAMLQVNIRALTFLCHSLIPAMREMGRGTILNVSSIASLFPIPDFAVYAATKAYVTSFTEALRMETREHGIEVMAMCPGPVPTEFGDVARREGTAPQPRVPDKWFTIPREQAVAETLRALETGKARHYPGWQVALVAGILAVTPACILRLALGRRPRRVTD